MANRVTTVFDFKESGGGLKKIKADVANVDGAWNKAKASAKGAYAEFSNNRFAQAAVAGMIVKVGTDAVKAASDLEESVNAVNTTFNESADEIRKLSEASADNYGMSERAFNDMSVALSGFASQIAGDGGNIGGVIDDMATRIADFASVHNLTTDDAMTKFQSALAGETEAMRRYGIDVSAATTKMHAYETGIADVGSELTEAEKVQARYSLLMQETEQWAGDFAATQDGLANSSRTLSAQLENLQAKLGEQLLPIVTDATTTMVDMADVTGQLADQLEILGDKIPEPLTRFQDLIGGNFIADAFITKPLEGFSWALDKVGMSSEESAFSLEEATKAAWQYRASNIEAGIESENAAKMFSDYAEGLRENADEATYNADAHDEMGRIQEQVTRTVDKAREAQERFMRSIKFTRDEVGALKREIDDEQAWLVLQNSMDATIEKLNDGEVSARDQRLAILDLKEEVLEYAESINLPDRVVTQLIADIDAGKVREVEALLARWGNGITLPIRPQVISTGSGTRVRVDENGNVRAYDTGGIVPGPLGSPQLAVVHGGETILPTHKTGGAGGMGGVTVNVVAGMGTDGALVGRQVAEALERYYRSGGRRV